jgi:hypothetical protein
MVAPSKLPLVALESFGRRFFEKPFDEYPSLY